MLTEYVPVSDIKLNDYNHVCLVSFDKVSSKNSFGSLAQANRWYNIPQHVILTGQNGIGKSHLLAYINETLKSRKVNVVFRDPHYQYYSSSNEFGTGNNYYLKNANDTIIEEIFNYFHALEKKNDRNTDAFFKQVVRNLNKEFSNNQTKITKDDIKKTILSTVNSEITAKELQNPLKVLYKVFTRYLERKAFLINMYRDIKYMQELFQFYLMREKIVNNTGNFKTFIQLLEQDDSADKFITAYVENKLNKSPLEKVNAILQKLNFSYSFSLEKNDPSNLRTHNIVLKRGDNVITPSQLSSGEKMILDVMTWGFCYENIDAGDTEESEKVNIMILDEPDKHLDPKLCKQFFGLMEIYVEEWNMQVIMTTHRIDTIALAREGTVFSINRDENGRATIARCTKLNAMFRLTSNLRAFTNFSTKVYVESHHDVIFYEAAYITLMEFCEQVRIENSGHPKNTKFLWEKLKDSGETTKQPWEYRVLSRRYQLAFHSTAIDAKGGGGGNSNVKTVVKNTTLFKRSVLRDYYSNNTRKDKFKNFFIPPEIELPFGIHDKDFANKETSASKLDPILEQRIVKLKRYSIENYLYDPFIFCSSLSEQTIQNFANQNFSKICLNIKSIIQSIRKVDKLNKNKDDDEIKTNVAKYFSTLMEKYSDLFSDFPTPSGEKPTDYKNKCKDKYESRYVIFDSKKIIEIQYPYVLLYCNGHKLAEVVEKSSSGKDKPANSEVKLFQKTLIDSLIDTNLSLLPADLAETMFQLNDKVRTQVKEVIKPKSS